MDTIILVEKDDFIVLPNGHLVIRHPAFRGRGGFVAFYAYHCPNCQDTKTSWSAIGMVKGTVRERDQNGNLAEMDQMISRAKCIKRYPLLKYVKPNGVVVDFHGDKNAILDTMCAKAGMNCGRVNRCFSSKRYYN